uniref:uncharacterized protein n=1 Tax=Pristiophorus japonicus TaxID=55135 RepID=UPI00398ED04C
MTIHLKEVIAELETHAKTVNELLREDRNASAQAAMNEVCMLYGAWLLGEGAVIWRTTSKVMSHRGSATGSSQHSARIIIRCQLHLASAAYPVPVDCSRSNHTVMGIVLRMPVMGGTPQPAPVYRVENIGVLQEGVHVRYHGTPPFVIKWEHATTGTDLKGCQSRGAHAILCPQHLNAFDRPECGFESESSEPINCTMEVMAQSHVPPQVAYAGNGTYCITMSVDYYPVHCDTWCPVTDTTFCFKSYNEVQVAQERILPIPEPSTVHVTVNDTIQNLQQYIIQFRYQILFLPEHLTTLIKAIELSQKHYFTLK